MAINRLKSDVNHINVVLGFKMVKNDQKSSHRS